MPDTVIKDVISVSVRSLVEFILRSGDIDNRGGSVKADAMQEGSRIHRLLQSREGPSYHSEVPINHIIPGEDYDIELSGRADGIITPDEGTVTIDEIKGVFKELKRISEPKDVHLAQAKCYAYIYALKKGLTEINVRMTYCNVESEEVKYFHFGFTFKELSSWFDEIIESYRRFASFSYEWKKKRNASIKDLEFPFDYREGQHELTEGVYRTIFRGKRLFLEAPTGTGKTIAVLFPAVKAMERGLTERIFYATAKTVAATVPNEAINIMRDNGLFLKSVTLTAKEKLCFTGETDCNPVSCPYAKGHYDRINDALYDLLTTEDDYSRKRILEFAEERKLCPFELSLDLSLFCDTVILDYNYCFDPKAKLKRFFGENITGKYIFLVDEAHNLVDRGREMFSASLVKEDFLSARAKLLEGDKLLTDNSPAKKKDKAEKIAEEEAAKAVKKLLTLLSKCSRALVPLKKEVDRGDGVVGPNIDDLIPLLYRTAVVYDTLLENAAKAGIRVDKEVMELYFNIRWFLSVYENEDDSYVNYAEINSKDNLIIKLYNVDPSVELRKCTDRAVSTVFFSATLLPVTYYMDLISGDREDYTIYATSSFDNRNRGVFISKDVSSRYKKRSDSEYQRIAAEIYEVTRVKKGNYMVFFPSYAFLKSVEEKYRDSFDDGEADIIVQERRMDEDSRSEFLKRFDEQNNILSFCVSGGIFSEGIDLKDESLIGAVIVGTPLPQVGLERTILKDYFDERGEDGFDYAYRFPGMNRVLQAAGRVIRTETDRGIVALLDERFMERSYQKLFPREWEDIQVFELGSAAEVIEEFWSSVSS